MSNLISIAIGLILILNAFRIRYVPDSVRIRKPFRLVSLWNREPFSAKGWKSKYYVELADNPELQRLYFINYLVTGVLFILPGLIGLAFGINVAYFMLFATFVSGGMFLYAKQRVTGKIEAWKWVLFAVVVFGVVIGGSMSYKSSKVEVLPETFAIEGDYGIEMPYQGIDSVKVITELPKTKYCKAGYSITRSKKGEFQLKDGSDAKFYILGKEAPYLQMYTHAGVIFVNRKTAAETEQLIEELNDKIKIL
ncbi:MAG: hypothetical protein IKG95_04010 [Bacteroidales bacterium]|nr:hypothetical protein [Bacteroidales bacterium]